MAAARRIPREVKNAAESTSLPTHGIYYKPYEDDIMRGTALLIGREGTPYYGGFYFFSIVLPDEYPFVPPKVLSLTQNGRTRFNPNMYLDGKVCLSILNTWHNGPQWSTIQTIESVLMSIMSDVLNANPLENEPAYEGCGSNEQAKAYNRLLWHANVKTSILAMLKSPPSWAMPFLDIMKAEFQKHKANILKLCADATIYDGKIEGTRVFSMSEKYDFTELRKQLEDQ